jgi:hypothetical protein
MNKIEAEGVQLLIQEGKWEHLIELSLSTSIIELDCNNIGNEGCRHLSQGKMNLLNKLSLCTNMNSLGNNRIGAEGCRHLSEGKWDHLTSQLVYNSQHLREQLFWG